MHTQTNIQTTTEYHDQYALVPQELKEMPQWVAYALEPSKTTPGRIEKVPVNPKTCGNALSTVPRTWGTFDLAVNSCRRWPSRCKGIGFVLTDADPYVFIDLDQCVDGKGNTAPWAQDIIDRLASYAEKSPSGTGIHILCKGVLPAGGRKKGKLEMYSTKRFFTVTGDHVPGTPLQIEERSMEVADLHADWFDNGEKPVQVSKCRNRTETVSPVGDCPPLTWSDRSLLKKIASRKGGVDVLRLLDGDITGYPSQSEADLAACSHLWFWNDYDYDPEPIDRIIRNSLLYRPKWDEMRGDQTYGQMTIARAMQDRQGWIPYGGAA